MTSGGTGCVIGAMLLLSTIAVIEEMSANEALDTTLYVDDDNTAGPWDGSIEHPYQYIQHAVENASDGNTIYVYQGTYRENVWIEKSIILTGEEKENTIINGHRSGNAVYCLADEVIISGFTLTNGYDHGFFGGGGIKLTDTLNCRVQGNIITGNDLFGVCVTSSNSSSYAMIANNTITENGNFMYGGFNIWLYQSSHNTISDNTITDGNGYGIGLCYWSTHSIVKGNIITDNKYDGIKGRFVYYNEVYDNILSNNRWGIGWYNHSEENHVYGNSIEANEQYGIFLYGESEDNLFEYNTFVDNGEKDAFFYLRNIGLNNQWKHNYWSKAKVLPKVILGRIMLDAETSIPWINIDWTPAQEPYNIV
jgi:parallel beta-helix repeat protein